MTPYAATQYVIFPAINIVATIEQKFVSPPTPRPAIFQQVVRSLDNDVRCVVSGVAVRGNHEGRPEYLIITAGYIRSIGISAATYVGDKLYAFDLYITGT